MSRARLAWLLGFALVLIGFAPVVLFALGSLVQGAEASSMLGVFPDLPWLDTAGIWLHSRRIKWSPPPGLLFSLLGLGTMYLGAFVAGSQKARLDAMRLRREDARRRAPLYGGGGARIEPTLGPAD